MNRTLVAGAIAVVAVFAGVLYFAGDRGGDAPAEAMPATERPGETAEPPATRATEPAPAPATRGNAAGRPKPTDPRLAALMVSPADARIEFFSDPEGRVIKEVDNEPASPSYRKPLREYSYAGNQVIKLVSYRYLGDQVQVVTADVVYKPDGSVDEYREATRYEFGAQGKGRVN